MSNRLALRVRCGKCAFLACAVLATICGSSTMGLADESAAPKSWRIEGRLLDEQGKPVAGAEVFTNELPFLESAKQSTTKSDPEGRFALDIAHRLNGRMIRAS